MDPAEWENKLSEAEAQNTGLTAELTELQGALTAQKEEVARLQELLARSDDEEVKKQK